MEKPTATSEGESRQIADAARAAGVFGMEAMWSRFHPQTTIIERLLRDGALGEPYRAQADLGAMFPFCPTSRAFDPAPGGGALLDIGIYSLWFANSTMIASTGVTAMVAGGAAQLEIDAPFCAPRGSRVVVDAPGSFREELRWDDVTTLRWRAGLCYHAIAVAAHVADDRTEAPEHPLDTTSASCAPSTTRHASWAPRDAQPVGRESLRRHGPSGSG